MRFNSLLTVLVTIWFALMACMTVVLFASMCSVAAPVVRAVDLGTPQIDTEDEDDDAEETTKNFAPKAEKRSGK